MSESNQTPVITITSPEDVLDVLPTMIGFYPTESLCAIVVTDTNSDTNTDTDASTGTRRKVALTIRADMPTTSSEAVAAAGYVERAVKAYGTGALVVAYTADQDQARAVLVSLISAVTPGVLDSVILAVRRVGRSLTCCSRPMWAGSTRTRRVSASPPRRPPRPVCTRTAPGTTSSTAWQRPTRPALPRS